MQSQAYSYDADGFFNGYVVCQKSPLEENVFLLPANATWVPFDSEEELVVGYAWKFDVVSQSWATTLHPIYVEQERASSLAEANKKFEALPLIFDSVLTHDVLEVEDRRYAFKIYDCVQKPLATIKTAMIDYLAYQYPIQRATEMPDYKIQNALLGVYDDATNADVLAKAKELASYYRELFASNKELINKATSLEELLKITK